MYNEKNSKITEIVFIIFLMYSCNDTPKYVEKIQALPIDTTIHAEVIPIEAELLKPTHIENINDNYLVIIDEKPKGIFQVFSLPNIDFLYSWGQKGRGPNEFSMTSFTSINVHKNQLILDMLEGVHCYTITDTALVFDQKLLLSYKNQRAPLNGIVRLNDSIYIIEYGMGLNTETEFMALSPDETTPLFTFGKYPETHLQRDERYQAYSKVGVAKPDGSKFAAFYLYHNRFKIYDNKGSILKKVIINDSYLPADVMSKKKFVYRGFIHASDNYIYVFAPNTTEKEMFDNPQSFRPMIEIWDWSGEQISRFKLDKSVHQFTISEKYRKLYAFSIFEVYEIYEYDLSEIMDWIPLLPKAR